MVHADAEFSGDSTND
jgi:hypothetical protein